MRKLFLIFILASLTAVAAVASASNRKALVIGNDKYLNVTKLKNARADAEAMGKTLGELGFKVDLKLDLDERSLRAAVRGFIASLQGGDEAVFYFAGHGVQLGAANYLLPVDIKPVDETQVQDESLPLQRILDDFTAQRVRFSVVIVDACRDNPFPRVAGRSIGSTRGLAATSPATGQMVLFSAGAGQSALDSLGPSDRSPNGLFTRVLLKRMREPGVPVDQVLRNVREEVVDLAQGVGHQQVPALYDQAIGRFYFKPGEPVVSQTIVSNNSAPVAASAPAPAPSPAPAPAPTQAPSTSASSGSNAAAGLLTLLAVGAGIAALSKSGRDKNDTRSSETTATVPSYGTSSGAVSFDRRLAQRAACPADTSVYWSNCSGSITYQTGGSYEGMFFDDKRHGYGVYRYEDGAIHAGEWVADQREGRGGTRFANGDNYLGDYRGNAATGRGTYITAKEGYRYVGELVDLKFTGRGILYSSTGEVLRAGLWRDDEVVTDQQIDPSEFPFDSNLDLLVR